jgi:leucyl aminopeptidase
MNITTQRNNTLAAAKGLDLLVIPVVGKKLSKALTGQKKFDLSSIKHHLALEDLKKKAGSSLVFYPGQNSLPAAKVLLLELGTEKLTLSGLEEAAGSLRAALAKAKTAGVILPSGNEKLFTTALTVSLYRFLYEFNQHKSKVEDDDKILLDRVILFSDADVRRELARAEVIGQAVHLVRNLSNNPANAMTPKHLAAAARTIGTKEKIKVDVLGEKQMAALHMGGILGISKGSDEEAQLIVLDYNPKAKKTIALVGKGITFDSGGISIKPSRDMHEMKFDMAGGATVMALVQAAARLKLPYRVVGVVAATENLPSGKAIKPGDVVTTFSGKTVEVLNTDAEGRMVLCDALGYVQKNYHPNLIVDLATLTGAIIIALGNKITGAFGNTESVNRQLTEASKATGEPLHFMPLYAKYKEDLKSKVADLANIGKQRVDATIAALFLQEFIEKNTKWIHLDIAGTAWDNDGATGIMVATLLKFFEGLKF